VDSVSRTFPPNIVVARIPTIASTTTSPAPPRIHGSFDLPF